MDSGFWIWIMDSLVFLSDYWTLVFGFSWMFGFGFLWMFGFSVLVFRLLRIWMFGFWFFFRTVGFGFWFFSDSDFGFSVWMFGFVVQSTSATNVERHRLLYNCIFALFLTY
jgi:hypothetical protein